uniref:Helicase senataxin n=1 Tax=Timema cristinae TaxID=61476 RepID=A0A7R9GW69_TIMCR|nr:unnamed protein product [Timema cristinae]
MCLGKSMYAFKPTHLCLQILVIMALLILERILPEIVNNDGSTLSRERFELGAKRKVLANALVVLSPTAEDGEIKVRISVGVVSSQQESPDIICLSSDEEDVKPIIGFPLYIDKASGPTVSEAHKPSSSFDLVVPPSYITVPTVVTTQDNHQVPSISSCVPKLSAVNDGVSSSIINNDTSKDLLLDSNPNALSCTSFKHCSSPSSSESEAFDLNPLPLINDSEKPLILTKGCKRPSTIDEAIEAKIMRKEENDVCPESLPIININKDIKTTCPGLASPSMCMKDDNTHVFGSESLNHEQVSISSKETNNMPSYNVSKNITSTTAKLTSSLNQQDSGSKTTSESTFIQAPSNKAVPTENVKLKTLNSFTVPVIESKWKDQPYKEHKFILKNIDSEPSSLISSSNDLGILSSKVLHSEQIGTDSTALQEENLNTHIDTLSKSIQPENALPNSVEISLSKEVPSDDIKTAKINEKSVNKLQLDLNVHTLFKFKQPDLPSCSVSLSNKHSGSSTDAITHINNAQSTKAENVEKELIAKSSDQNFFGNTVSEKVIETEISHQSNKIGSSKRHSSDTEEGRVDTIKTEIDTSFVKQEINSEPHFNYSLGEDDIIIIDDEDEQFPSSQIFDSNSDPEENKVNITEENKIDEFEDDLFQPENDLASSDEDEWFSKLSQNDKIENSNALEEQRLENADGLALKNIVEEDSEEEIFSVRKQNSAKRTILDDDDNDDESNESFTFGLLNDFINDAQELNEQSKPLLEEISKSNEKFEKKFAVKLGKSLLIDAPPMPPRRASNRGISIAEAERLYNDKATLISKHRKMIEKKKLPSDQIDKSAEKRKHASSGKDSGSSKDLIKSSKLSEKTKSLVDKRKAKLKAISQKHKESSEAALNDTYNKVKAKARIKEQKRCDHPPPIVNKNPKPMFTTFASYETYYTTLQPLMLMELWDKLTQAQAIKNPVVIISVDSFEPCTPSNGEVNKLSEIKCHSLYSHHELQGTKIPRTGDLVALELSLDFENGSETGRRFTNTFGYLTATNLQTLNDHSIVICHIRPYLRVFQALENLKNSPLCNYILNPSAQNINYPKVNETLVAKLLYGGSRDPRSRKREKPRILLCAQSNAAIDELVMRLLERRKYQDIGSRFKMVRVGTPDTIHPQVRCISLDELAKTHSQQYTKDAQDTETVQLTLNHLEARIVSMGMKYNTLKDSGKSTDATKMKIDEMIKKMAQIKNMSEGKTAAPIDRRQMKESRLVVLEKAEIVATTLGSCFNMDMEESTRAYNTPRPSFTCCIIDESSKCCEPDILVPLLHNVKNLVLVGDTNQLQATVHSKIAKDLGYAISMFDRLNSSLSLLPSNPVMFLNEQFRMHPEICCWPNYYFYEGRLTCAPFLHHQRITPLKPYLVLSLEYRQGLSRGHSNDGEADFVVEVASIALNTVSQHKLSVGIITPYNQQKETIQNKLREKYPGLGITCDTIDSVQGQERDVVIMSCVRTEGVGFLNDTSRLNVALTRARSALYICGNFTALKDVTAWERLLEDAVRRQVYVQIRSADTSNQEHIKNIILKQPSHKK